MPVRIGFPAQLAELIGGRDSVTMEGETVGEALFELTEAHPELDSLIWSRTAPPDGNVQARDLSPVVVVFLNGEDVRARGGLEAPLADGDEMLVISAVEGG